MLDYQLVMVAREVSHERVQGLPAAKRTAPGSALPSFVQSSRQKLMAVLTAVAAQLANLMLAQRYQNRHRSVEGRT